MGGSEGVYLMEAALVFVFSAVGTAKAEGYVFSA
jgi:hypothetical protein